MPSKVIHGMLYSPTHRSLDVVFHDAQKTYRYFNVGPEEWRDFKRASSKGLYLNGMFKERHPLFVKLETQATELLASLADSILSAPKDLPDENVWGFGEQRV